MVARKASCNSRGVALSVSGETVNLQVLYDYLLKNTNSLFNMDVTELGDAQLAVATWI